MNGLFILMIDDSPHDIELARAAFDQLDIPARLFSCTSGQSALAWLREQVEGQQPLPDVILLDWKMPGMGGRDVLAALRVAPGVQHVPVLVFSTSQEVSDQRLAERLGAKAFLRKPSRFDELTELLRHVLQLPDGICARQHHLAPFGV